MLYSMYFQKGARMNTEIIPLDLVGVVEYLRGEVRRRGHVSVGHAIGANRSEMTRLAQFSQNQITFTGYDLLDRLAKHFGLQLAAVASTLVLPASAA